MKIVRDIAKMRELSRQVRAAGLRVSLVPTMGYLHAGHLALFERARALSQVVVASIFVNPTQFNDASDFDTYPRDEDTDLALLEAHGVDMVFIPERADVYAADASTEVAVSGITQGLCAPPRPGHFEGVATVVAALFNIVEPDLAVFGEKDYQQLQVVRRMVRDLHFPVEIEAVVTVREADGLAMSSRNARLGEGSRRSAAVIFKGLEAVRRAFDSGRRESRDLLAQAREQLAAAAAVELEYLELVDGDTLEPRKQAVEGSVVAVAARLDGVRLIDNIILGRSADEEQAMCKEVIGNA